MPSFKLLKQFTPRFSKLFGIKVGGAIHLTSTPRVVSRCILDLATLLLSISPQIAIFKPSILPNLLLIVNASRRACVGCSCLPSPALTILQFK